MRVKEVLLLRINPVHIWIGHCERLEKSSAGQIGPIALASFKFLLHALVKKLLAGFRI
jgi:hypothetical protein